MNIQKNGNKLKELFNGIIKGAINAKDDKNENYLSKTELEVAIIICCGKDKRTVLRHIELLKIFGYINQVNKHRYLIIKNPLVEKTLEFFENP